MSPQVKIMAILPQNFLSFLTGIFARLKVPKPLSFYLCSVFVKIFKINMTEAAKPLREYRTIEDVFTRHLKPGVRRIETPLCSPSDGFLAYSQPVKERQAIQAKGLEYSLSEMIFGNGHEHEPYSPTWFFTVYLAPHNYHRVHSPVAGQLVSLRYIPGKLWPVNNYFASRIPRLFAANERLTFEIKPPHGGTCYVVMVGAFNVGRMETRVLPGFVTNSCSRQLGGKPMHQTLATPVDLKCGDELGVFMLGSTVVVVFDEKAKSQYEIVQSSENRPILLGSPLR